MIVITTHAVFMNGKDIYGPAHAIVHYLNKKKEEFLFIKHDLYQSGAQIDHYKNGKLILQYEAGSKKRLPTIVQYGFECFVNIKEIIKNGKKYETIIGVDPLNALAVNILKLFGITKRTIYVSADFALKRFSNPILNSIYLKLDILAMNWANETWSVSKRIIDYRKNHGLPKEKNVYFPNAPFFNDVKRKTFDKINKHDMVIVSALNKGIAFDLIIDALWETKKKISDVKLILIGGGPEEENLRNYIKEKNLEKSAIFLGPLSHEDMFNVLVTCGIGIALYTNADPTDFRYFSDPMKVRDYLASGLPTLISGNAGIGEELEQNHAGIVVQLSINKIKSAMLSLLENVKLQKQMRENAIAMAKKYDTYKLLEDHLG